MLFSCRWLKAIVIAICEYALNYSNIQVECGRNSGRGRGRGRGRPHCWLTMAWWSNINCKSPSLSFPATHVTLQPAVAATTPATCNVATLIMSWQLPLVHRLNSTLNFNTKSWWAAKSHTSSSSSSFLSRLEMENMENKKKEKGKTPLRGCWIFTTTK